MLDVLKATVCDFLDTLSNSGAQNYRVAIIEYAGNDNTNPKAGIKTHENATNSAFLEVSDNLDKLKSTVILNVLLLLFSCSAVGRPHFRLYSKRSFFVSLTA